MRTLEVKPRTGISLFEGPDKNGMWLARLKSPPVDGNADKELIALVARHFECSKSAVSINRGSSGRIKQIQILRGEPWMTVTA